jgi:protocatechuate 3,4-dioxygenase beta subunit
MGRIVVVVTLLFSCLCINANTWGQAQITTGVIQGSVLDEKGLGVPDANVEAKNLDTNLSKTTTTGPEGQYQFLALQPGRYTMTISKSGFATVA